MATGYEDIDRVMQQQNSLLQQQEQKSNEIVNLGLQKTQAEVDKQKTEYEQEATKVVKASVKEQVKDEIEFGEQNDRKEIC